MAIPHFIINKRLPDAVRSDHMVGSSRWYQRVAAYVGLMTDQYPPFSPR